MSGFTFMVLHLWCKVNTFRVFRTLFSGVLFKTSKTDFERFSNAPVLGRSMATHVLFESASGYAIFEAKQQEEIGAKTAAFQTSIQDLQKFGKMVQLISFSPFKSAAHALENANDISEGEPFILGTFHVVMD